jgi:hypothetical protein
MRGVSPALLAVLVLTSSPAADEPDTTKPTDSVSGMVSLNGKPLPAGWIAFHKKSGTVAIGNIDSGKYTVRNPPVGAAIRVTIDTAGIAAEAMKLQQELRLLETRVQLIKAAKKEVDAELAKRIEDLKRRVKILTAMEAALKGIKVDEQYSDKEKTPLRFEIKSGKQTIDIELKR